MGDVDGPQRLYEEQFDGQTIDLINLDILAHDLKLPLGTALKINFAVSKLREQGAIDMEFVSLPPE